MAFGEQGSIIVGGSDHGAIYVFDANNGSTLDVIQHSRGLLGTIAVRFPSLIYLKLQAASYPQQTYECGGKSYIICAPSDANCKASIGIYEYDPMAPQYKVGLGSEPRPAFASRVLSTVIILLALAFVSQNVSL